MLRFAVLGTGPWGINHVRVIANELGCAVTKLVDLDAAALERARQLVPTAEVCGDVDGVLASRDVDAVVIATPAPTHTSLAMAALRAGKHVLVEKPVAMSLADGRTLAAVAAQSDRVLAVGHLMLYHPAVLRLRELLQSGTLGKLHYLQSTRVNLGRLRPDENALWSFGPHDLSIIDFLLERAPISVAARGHSVLQAGVEDVVFLTMRFATGEMAHTHLSWLHPRKERRVTLVCSQKMVEFDDVAPEKLRVYDKGYDRPPEFTEYSQYLTLRDGDVYIPKLVMEEPLRVQLRDFATSIQTSRQPIANMTRALRVTACLAAAQRSLALDGTPVAVEEV